MRKKERALGMARPDAAAVVEARGGIESETAQATEIGTGTGNESAGIAGTVRSASDVIAVIATDLEVGRVIVIMIAIATTEEDARDHGREVETGDVMIIGGSERTVIALT